MISLLGDTAADNNRSCFQNVSFNSRNSVTKPLLSDAGPLLQSTLKSLFKIGVRVIEKLLN